MAARRYRIDEVEPTLEQTTSLLRTFVDQLGDAARTAPESGALAASLERSVSAPMTADAAVAHLVELLVLADDLTRALPDRAAPTIPRDAHRIVVRSLLDALESKAPGRAVEVRVPPFAAVQCIEGPRHTRGTPPNTVETDATTWIRLASGRLTWADAVASHAVAVSGGRADLAPLLPLL